MAHQWKGIVAGLALALLTIPPAAQAAEKLTVCYNETDVRPWHSASGTGLYFDLLNRVGARLDMRFEFVALPWKRCQALVRANQMQGIMALSFHDDRANLGVFPGGVPPDASKRMQLSRYVLVRRKGGHVQWDGKRLTRADGPVGVKSGYSIADRLRALGADVDASHRTVHDLLQKLANGHLRQAALLEAEAVAYIQHAPGVAARLEILPIPLQEKPYFLVLSRDFVARQPELAARIWDTLEEVRNSADYRRLEKEALDKLQP